MSHEHQSNDSFIPTSSQNQPTPPPAVKWWEPQYGNTWEPRVESEKKSQKSDPIHHTDQKNYSSDQYVEMSEKIIETIIMIIKKIITSPFVVLRLALKWMFSFETYWLWQLGLFAHFIIQVIVMGIIFFGNPQSSLPSFLTSFIWQSYDGSISFGQRFILAVIAFVVIRVIFELFLIILSINDSLGKIRDSIIKKSPEEI